MLIAKVIKNKVVEVADYRAMFPSTSFPQGGPDDEFLVANDCKRVTVWKAHDHDAEKLEPCAPYVEDGQVFTVKVVALTEDDLAARTQSKAAEVRAERNRKLAETDWTQLDDSPEANKLAWASYRRVLREVPAQNGFPWAVEWPTQPE